MTDLSHHDTRALDLLKCLYWGQDLTTTVNLLNITWNQPVIPDDDGEYTAVRYLQVLVEDAASDVVNRPEAGEPVDPGDLEYDLQAIEKFRRLAERGREIGRLAELIADMLQAPYNDDGGEHEGPDLSDPVTDMHGDDPWGPEALAAVGHEAEDGESL
ncbi:hypothetical protein AB0B28_08300 [Glycomyces sp. NPDC046736]|uniref:hypothetical protein n=1 Tax=Glycomyces sp. NPDC046736 TaxID=3155615 RepID=UPI0033F8FC19